MKTWDDWSDSNINAAVTSTVYGLDGWEYSDNTETFYHCGVCGDETNTQPVIDYCNSWEDMGPLIVENDIALIPPVSNGTNGWKSERFYPSSFGKIIDFMDKKPLRAAAIVLLKMNGVNP